MSIKTLNFDMLHGLVADARRSPRGRQHLNLHDAYSDKLQRLLNAVDLKSYIQPHRHSLDPKPELLVVVSGFISVVEFNDCGQIQNIISVGNDRVNCACFAVEISPETWHTVIAQTKDVVILEVKPGPFDPRAATEYAPWAPMENTAEAAAYFAGLCGRVYASTSTTIRKARAND